jgi:epoxyqueuosine reductase QueG
MNGYMTAMEQGQSSKHTPDRILESYPNHQLWEDLRTYAWEHYKVIIGFTELPREYIFEGKAVPFRYALIFAQEMKKQPIEKAPELDAGIEVITVYNSLGIATNEIAHWLRTKYDITCMANHPLGGLVDTVPLSAKAGLGAIGKNGLLITKEFGPRCRISPIFIDQKLFEFTDSKEHEWIHDFCAKCGLCVQSCPTSAIYSEPLLTKEFHSSSIPDRYETYDREKCFASFAATMGCAVCIRTCPFSKNPANYDKMKENILKRKDQ